MPPRFLFVRHGEATHNVAFHQSNDESVFMDRAHEDAPLTKEGVKQAQATGKALFNYKILDIWCSPLKRTIQTAEEIYEEVNCGQIYLHDNLLERLGGNHVCNYRKSKESIVKDHFMWNVSVLSEYPPFWIQRESTSAVRARMLMLILYLGELYKSYDEDYHLVLVSHNDAIASLTGKSLKNAEFIVLSLEDIINPKKNEIS